MTQQNILAVLHKHPEGLSMTDIAHKLGLSSSFCVFGEMMALKEAGQVYKATGDNYQGTTLWAIP